MVFRSSRPVRAIPTTALIVALIIQRPVPGGLRRNVVRDVARSVRGPSLQSPPRPHSLCLLVRHITLLVLVVSPITQGDTTRRDREAAARGSVIPDFIPNVLDQDVLSKFRKNDNRTKTIACDFTIGSSALGVSWTTLEFSSHKFSAEWSLRIKIRALPPQIVTSFDDPSTKPISNVSLQ
jgi:hypothetical protein